MTAHLSFLIDNSIESEFYSAQDKKYLRHDLISKAFKAKTAVKAAKVRLMVRNGSKVAAAMANFDFMKPYINEVSKLKEVTWKTLDSILPQNVSGDDITAVLKAA